LLPKVPGLPSEKGEVYSHPISHRWEAQGASGPSSTSTVREQGDGESVSCCKEAYDIIELKDEQVLLSDRCLAASR
jgi:hypothetical protein